MQIQTLDTIGMEFHPNYLNPATSPISRATSLLRHYQKNVVIYVVLNSEYV